MKRFLQITIGIIIGILLDFGFSRLVHLLGLPFFFDTIGSLCVTFVFGAIPGLICATIYQFLAAVVISDGRFMNMIYVLTVWGAIGIIALFETALKIQKLHYQQHSFFL